VKRVNLSDVPKEDAALISAARQAAENCYAPYSSFAVGAAARTTDGKVHIGSNLENASYGLSLCAEVGALTAATTAGQFGRVEAIAIVGFGFFPEMEASKVVTPCGRCRQLISESAQRSSIDIDVFACSGDLERIEQYKISELLPRAFGPEALHASNPPNPASAKSKTTLHAKGVSRGR